MKKARPWHLFRHFSTKRQVLSLLLDRISDQTQHLIARNRQKKAFRSGSARGRHLDQCLSSGRVFLQSLQEGGRRKIHDTFIIRRPAAFHVSRMRGAQPAPKNNLATSNLNRAVSQLMASCACSTASVCAAWACYAAAMLANKHSIHH